MTTTTFIEITSIELGNVVGGEDSAATKLASRERRIAEDHVTTTCNARFAPDADKALACVLGAGDEAFQRTMKQFGAPASQ